MCTGREILLWNMGATLARCYS